jgi:hypothetical protein
MAVLVPCMHVAPHIQATKAHQLWWWGRPAVADLFVLITIVWWAHIMCSCLTCVLQEIPRQSTLNGLSGGLDGLGGNAVDVMVLAWAA